MRKIVIIAMLFILAVSTVSAQKQDWYDSGFDFTRVRKIAVLIRPMGQMNVYQCNETAEIFVEKMWEDLIEKLPKEKYVFESGPTIAKKVFQESGIDLGDIAEKDMQKADSIALEYMSRHHDLLIVWEPIVYGVGSEYCEGYIYTLPTTNTSTVWLPNGQTATITSSGSTVHSTPSGNFPAAYAAVRMDAIDTKTGNAVWMRIDDRAKVNRTVFDNTTPKDIYERILGNFIDTLYENLNERKGVEKKLNF